MDNHFESKRLKELYEYNILDTIEEQEYDEITYIASVICETPIALISLLDDKRQWFKSHLGIEVRETPVEYAFCAHAIQKPNEVFIINDSRQDERFKNNPLVKDKPNVIFYAGIPLVNQNGFALGTLCVIDNQPKELNSKQLNALKYLSNQVIRLLEDRRKNLYLEKINLELGDQNKELDKFARVAAHDLKSPLASITGLLSLLKEEYVDKLDKDAIEYIDLSIKSSSLLSKMIDGILEYSRASNLLKAQKETLEIKTTIKEIMSLFDSNKDVIFELDIESHHIVINKTILEQILLNLISNAIKYNQSKIVEIKIKFHLENEFYILSIKDNGLGIKEKDHETIFKLFETSHVSDRNGEKGTGIGLATIKKIVDCLNGKIKVESKLGFGTEFILFLPKINLT